MKQSLRLGRMAGIPVGAHWSVLVILVIIADILGTSVLPGVIPHQRASAYWMMAIVGALLFVSSLLAHELAHALVARSKGVHVRSITLWMLGGVTELDGEPTAPSADLQVALAGPATSVAAAAAFAVAALATGRLGGPVVATAVFTWLALMNALLAIFNMLPGAPLDGGRVLRALLWRRYGDRARAERAAAAAGRYLGAAVAAVGAGEFVAWRNLGGLWLVLIGWFLISAAGAEAGAAKAKDALAGVRVGDIMTPDPDTAPAWITAADFIDRVARQSRQSVFPVVDLDGALVGVVSLDLLARVNPRVRGGLRLDRVAVTVPPAYRAEPDDPAGSLLARPPLGGGLVAVVLRHGRVTGMVTTEDLRRGLRIAPLSGRVPATAAG